MSAALQISVTFDGELPSVNTSRLRRAEQRIINKTSLPGHADVSVSTDAIGGVATATIDEEIQQSDIDRVVTELAALATGASTPSPQVQEVTLDSVSR